MKELELRNNTQCNICHRKLGQLAIPIFWTVKAQRHGLDLKAIQRQQGLAMMMGGNGILASTMGPDEEMTKELTEEIKITVCDECFMSNDIGIEVFEKSEEKK